MSNESNESVIVKLTASEGSKVPARLSFPALFEKKAFQDGKPKYSAVFLLDKKQNASDIKRIQDAIERVKKGKWGTKPVRLLGTCLRDGAEKPDIDGYGDNVMFVSASSEQRPGIVDGKLNNLAAEDGKPYAGCYVYFTIRLWAQDNQYGKRVNASLRNVQFVRNGEPFGEKITAAEDDFSEVPDEGVV